MPVTCRLRNDKWRVVEAEGGKLAKTRSGSSADGGGHASKDSCMAQARAINANTVSKVDAPFKGKK